MSINQRYFLKKNSKLKNRKAIDIVFKKGNSFSLFPFKVHWFVTDFEVGLKAGFTASARTFKKATDRNYIKRLSREAYRLQKNNLEANELLQTKGLHIFFVFIGKELPEYITVNKKIGLGIKRLETELKNISNIPSEV
jgi:ribonuclease P protein component